MKRYLKTIFFDIFIASFCLCLSSCSYVGHTEHYEQSTTTPPIAIPKDLSSSTVKSYYSIPAIPSGNVKQIQPDIKPPGLKAK